MTNEQSPVREIDPGQFAAFAGPEAAYVIVVKKNNEHENVIPKGTEYEHAPIPEPGEQTKASSSQYYMVCRTPNLYACCGNFCVRVGDC